MSASAPSISAKTRMAELLRVEGLSAGYGEARVIDGVGFVLEDGQSLALLGRNGVGKTTLVNSLIGVTTRFGGRIELGGEDIAPLPPHLRARRGVGWTPQERNIFRSLTVEENLTAVAIPGAWTVKRVYGLFSRLEERRQAMGRQLSGGEQQMLAIGRALMSRPKFLMLDEPSLGIAPLLVKTIFEKIVEINRERGLTILLVEQNANRALEISHFGYVLETGKITLQGDAASLRANPQVKSAYLGG